MALPGHHYQAQQPHSESNLHHPPFHVVGLAPTDYLQWNSGLEHERKSLKEHENNFQISCVDFIQPRSVSTGMALSLDNTEDFAFLSLTCEDIDRRLLHQDAEIDRYLRFQSEQLRERILENVKATMLRSISILEDKVLQKLREKEAEVESINSRNIELEERMEQLTVEANVWQQRAAYNEDMVAALKFNLEQVYVQSKDSNEGWRATWRTWFTKRLVRPCAQPR